MKLCGFDVGPEQPFFLIAGPCVIESEQLAIDTAGALREICGRLNIPLIYRSISYIGITTQFLIPYINLCLSFVYDLYRCHQKIWQVCL